MLKLLLLGLGLAGLLLSCLAGRLLVSLVVSLLSRPTRCTLGRSGLKTKVNNKKNLSYGSEFVSLGFGSGRNFVLTQNIKKSIK